MNGSTLAPILRFVLEERSWTPIPPELLAVAELLPALVFAGIEVPLVGRRTIDLQQRIAASNDEPEILRGHLARASAASTTPAGADWPRLQRLAKQWSTPNSLLHRTLAELWLELDRPAAPAGAAPLSIFLRPVAGTGAADLAQMVGAVLAVLAAPVPAGAMACLRRILAACPQSAFVSHVGLMASDRAGRFRLNVDGLPPESTAGFLADVAWPGPADEACELAEMLFGYSDKVRLCLTAASELAAELSFECFLSQASGLDPRWHAFVDWLAARGLCGRERWADLLSWPHTLTPQNASRPWPDALIAASLLREPDELGVLDCRISHVKVSYRDGRPLAAKGYLGFVHEWRRPAAAEPYVPPQNPLRCPGGGESIELRAVSARACSFLLGSRTQGGWWLDYDGFREGIADEWPTAYVGAVLAEIGTEPALNAARRAWQLLCRRPRAGWGWNFVQPADADSTTWGLRLGELLGETTSAPFGAAAAFLRTHVAAGGGVATYCRQERQHRSLHGGDVNPRWYEAHVCVTAAAAGLEVAATSDAGHGPRAHLRRTQHGEGCWQGYWWPDSYYPTALAAEALARSAEPGDQARAARAVDWAAGRCLPHVPPSAATAAAPLPLAPFAAALLLRTLLVMPERHPQPSHRLAQTLARSQMPDGSWAASALLAIPNHAGETVPAIDRRRTTTTATVLAAIERYARTLPRR
ncbi:MAG: hypothetical protein HYV63_05610 [Candidatus Schekmanbacteria bacterium]|nr:hypothetical protein [Candidatus Schekmanbacteria bacterium]